MTVTLEADWREVDPLPHDWEAAFLEILEQREQWEWARSEDKIKLRVTSYQASRQDYFLNSIRARGWDLRERVMHLVLACDLSEPEPVLSSIEPQLRDLLGAPGNAMRLARVRTTDELTEPILESMLLVERRFSLLGRKSSPDVQPNEGEAWHY